MFSKSCRIVVTIHRIINCFTLILLRNSHSTAQYAASLSHPIRLDNLLWHAVTHFPHLTWPAASLFSRWLPGLAYRIALLPRLILGRLI